MRNRRQTRLLVSVRSALEALEALAGGADLIDVKEPANGALGRAEPETIASIIRVVAGRAPVSAALGELRGLTPNLLREYARLGLRFVKVGLSHPGPGWEDGLEHLQRQLPKETILVPTAYGDGSLVGAPGIGEIFKVAKRLGSSHFLLDTYIKDGRTLFDHAPATDWLDGNAGDEAAGIELVLAGSLRLESIPTALEYRPSWLAVRGAACREGKRDETIWKDRVAELKRKIDDDEI